MLDGVDVKDDGDVDDDVADGVDVDDDVRLLTLLLLEMILSHVSGYVGRHFGS